MLLRYSHSRYIWFVSNMGISKKHAKFPTVCTYNNRPSNDRVTANQCHPGMFNVFINMPMRVRRHAPKISVITENNRKYSLMHINYMYPAFDNFQKVVYTCNLSLYSAEVNLQFFSMQNLIRNWCCRPRWLSGIVGRLKIGRLRVRSLPGRQYSFMEIDHEIFPRSFSSFRWFKKDSCQFLAKECAQYW